MAVCKEEWASAMVANLRFARARFWQKRIDFFIAFCLLTETNGIDRYNVDICATSEEQTKTSF